MSSTTTTATTTTTTLDPLDQEYGNFTTRELQEMIRDLEDQLNFYKPMFIW